MTTLSRHERERLAMEEEIVSTALAMVRADGAANLSLRKVAEQMEYSSAALYRYYPNKAALVDEICRRGFADLAGRLRAVSTDLPAGERLARVGQAYLRFAADEPQLYTLMFVDLMPGDIPAPSPWTAEHLLADDSFRALYDVLADGAAAGAFRLTDRQLLPAALAQWALVHGMAMLRVRFPRAFPATTVDIGLEVLGHGFRATA